MSYATTSATEPAGMPSMPPGAPQGRRRIQILALAAAVAGAVVAIVLFVILGGSGARPPATAAASIVPADALAYVNVSLDRGRPPVKQALALAARFPDYPLATAAVQSRLASVLGAGRAVDFASQIEPWLGNEAAVALLNTTTATAGSLIVLAVSDQARARTFVRNSGAAAHGSYRGVSLLAYPTGSELAFLQGFLVLGQDASVRSAIDVASGAAPALRSASVYQRAAAGEPAGRVLDAYASLAGVRRLLAPQGGIVGALGALLYQPALQGVTIAVSPTPAGAQIHVHSALDTTLTRLSPPPTSAFAPSLQNVVPTGSILMLDVTGLDRVAPQVLNAGASAGVAGGIGPLLSRLGTALRSEGVNVQDIVSIFHAETAVAIVPNARTTALVIVARTAHQSRIAAELAQLQIPLAQLFKAGKAGKVGLFTDRQAGGITAHQLALANGLELDYAVSNGLVMISTSLQGIAAVAQRQHTLAQDGPFKAVFGHGTKLVTSLVYLDFVRLLALGVQTGLTRSARFQALRSDLDKIQAIGLTSTRSAGQSSAEITIRIP